MRKILFFVFAMLMAVACYDDTALWDQIKNHESRIAKLETLCNQMNTNISSLQSIVIALQDKDYVTNVVPVKENGKEIGYVITFSKSGSITIYHGTDGKDGANGLNGKDGADGKDGYTPVLGVRQDTDGVYYWTLDGEWLTDASGNKVPTTGKDGANGEDGTDGANGEDGKDGQNGVDGQDGKDGITPQLKIEESYWYISYDNGQAWEMLGKAVGEDGKDGANGIDGTDGKDGDSFFRSVTQDEANVYVTLADGTQFALPKARQANVTIELNKIDDETVTFTGTVSETSVDLKVTVYYGTRKNLTVYNYDGKVSVTDFDSNTFSLVLDALKPGTQYYYFTEVVFNGVIEYSAIDTFIIWDGIYFFDDFSWVAPWADASGAEDSVGENNYSAYAFNVYTHKSHIEYDGVGYVNGGAGVEGYPSFLTEFADRGYEDMNADNKTLYTQKYYLKFGKTKYPTGIKLPAVELDGQQSADVLLSFDWSAHINGKGVVDDVKIVVEIEGEGVCADSRTKISNPISPNQEEGHLKWQNAKFLLQGVNNATRIIIRPSVLDNSDGVEQKRWYIDNIKLAKPKPRVLAAWDISQEGMASYVDTWGGLHPGALDKNAGDGGKYIAANAGGQGTITYVQIDKNNIDVNDKARRYVGSTGHPVVEGMWIGDSWNLTAEADIPAGSLVGASFTSRTSNTGLKYWIVEYLDGDTWKPALPTRTVEVNGETITYNVEHVNDDDFVIDFMVSTTADMPVFHIRETCLSNVKAKDGELLEAPNGGTVRLKGNELSPKIVIF